MKGFLAFFIGCALVAALSVIPAEYGRWIALALLVVVVLTPAVGQFKPRRSAVKRTRSAEGSASQ